MAAGGVVTISGGALGARDPAGPLGSGVIRNESTAAVVELHKTGSGQCSWRRLTYLVQPRDNARVVSPIRSVHLQRPD